MSLMAMERAVVDLPRKGWGVGDIRDFNIIARHMLDQHVGKPCVIHQRLHDLLVAFDERARAEPEGTPCSWVDAAVAEVQAFKAPGYEDAAPIFRRDMDAALRRYCSDGSVFNRR